MTTNDIIDAYQALRARCYKLARQNNAALMNGFSWLQYAMQEDELELEGHADGSIRVHGCTFTSQTQSNECFDFVIPAELLAETAV